MAEKINAEQAIDPVFPSILDKVLIKDNINPISVFNGEILVFKDLLDTIRNYNSFAKTKIYTCGKFNGAFPKKETKNPIEKSFFQNYAQFKQAIELINRRRISMIPTLFKNSTFYEKDTAQWIEDSKKILAEHGGNSSQAFIAFIQGL
jgi:hypothetical protein